MKLFFVIVLSILSNCSFAEFPDKPIRLLVGAGPGGGSDISARIISQQLSKILHTEIVVDNRPAAGGIVARQILENSSPDGYALTVISSSNVVIAALHNKPISKTNVYSFASLSQQPYLMVVNSKTNFHSLRDILSAAQNKPKNLTYGGGGGIASVAHLAGELLAKRTQVEFLYIPYISSSASIQDLLSNQISFVFSTSISLLPHVKSGRFRAIGITSKVRNKFLPNIPTLVEQGVKDFDVTGWYSLATHRNTNPKIINRLSYAISSALNENNVIEKFHSLGAEVWINDVATMQKIVKEEEQRYLGLVDLKSQK